MLIIIITQQSTGHVFYSFNKIHTDTIPSKKNHPPSVINYWGGGGGEGTQWIKLALLMVMVMVTLFRHGKSFSKDYTEIKDKI